MVITLKPFSYKYLISASNNLASVLTSSPLLISVNPLPLKSWYATIGMAFMFPSMF
jgi:hypothetical protein